MQRILTGRAVAVLGAFLCGAALLMTVTSVALADGGDTVVSRDDIAKQLGLARDRTIRPTADSPAENRAACEPVRDSVRVQFGQADREGTKPGRRVGSRTDTSFFEGVLLCRGGPHRQCRRQRIQPRFVAPPRPLGNAPSRCRQCERREAGRGGARRELPRCRNNGRRCAQPARRNHQLGHRRGRHQLHSGGAARYRTARRSGAVDRHRSLPTRFSAHRYGERCTADESLRFLSPRLRRPRCQDAAGRRGDPCQHLEHDRRLADRWNAGKATTSFSTTAATGFSNRTRISTKPTGWTKRWSRWMSP